MITIVDYGMGNLGSILNMFRKIGVEAQISSDKQVVQDASKILLPGVGAFDAAIKRIDELGFREVLVNKAQVDKIPFLGICLGMQLLTDGSDEGQLKGLGLIRGRAHKMQPSPGIRIPHMGWNEVSESAGKSSILNGLNDLCLEGEKPRFYFVHSYKVLVDNPENSLLRTTYGDEFHSAIVKENVIGCQFHPEKSHRFGMTLLKNFADL